MRKDEDRFMASSRHVAIESPGNAINLKRLFLAAVEAGLALPNHISMLRVAERWVVATTRAFFSACAALLRDLSFITILILCVNEPQFETDHAQRQQSPFDCTRQQLVPRPIPTRIA
jgi:hypothetical protein